MPNAHVTVDPHGALTVGSTVVVEGEFGETLAFNEVPYLDGPAGLSMQWERVNLALTEVGWRLDSPCPLGPAADGVIRFDAVEVEAR